MTNHKDNETTQPDGDPRLTAYALGELDGPESAADRAEIEALLARDASARAEVEAIRETAADLGDVFAAEAAGAPAPELTAAQRAEIELAARGGAVRPAVRRAALVWLAPLAAAAALVIWMTLGWRTVSQSYDKPVAKSEDKRSQPELRMDRLKQLGYTGGNDGSAPSGRVDGDAVDSTTVEQTGLDEVTKPDNPFAYDLNIGHSAARPATAGESSALKEAYETLGLPAPQSEALQQLGYAGGGAAAPPTNPSGSAAPGPVEVQSASSGMLTGKGRKSDARDDAATDLAALSPAEG